MDQRPLYQMVRISSFYEENDLMPSSHSRGVASGGPGATSVDVLHREVPSMFALYLSAL